VLLHALFYAAPNLDEQSCRISGNLANISVDC
jgi:hypothetical protein